MVCDAPKLTPITSVHEHLLDVRHLDTLLAAADAAGVHHVNLLPFWNDQVSVQNDLQIALAKDNERVSSFVSLNALDEQAVSRLERYAEAGARGVKLYSGYRKTYQEGALDGANAHRIYSYLEEHGLPLLMHTNAYYFEAELREVLETHPKLVVLCPHFCLLSGKPGRLHQLLSDYPNLYTDVSFGGIHILFDGVKRISADPSALRAVVRSHRHRVAFGMDHVVGADSESANLAIIAQAYRDILEQKQYRFLNKEWRGLELDDCTLESIYRVNPERFLAGKPPLTD